MDHIRKNKKYVVWIMVFVLAIILQVTKAEDKYDNNTIIRKPVRAKYCECILYDCGCCEHIELDSMSINGTICTNASYLEHDYGFSVTVTYNNIPIINETLSARNPPPICFGEDIIENFPLECCFRLYDIYINKTGFHCCFELEGRIAKLNILPLHLGCIDNYHTNASSGSLLRAYLFTFLILLSHTMI